MFYKLSKTYEFEGKSYDELTIDIESLSGSDISAVKRDFTAMGGFAAVLTLDYDFCIMLVARAMKQPLEFFKGLPAKDYCALAQATANFLNA